MDLTPEKILSHAPDPGTAQRAKTVAHVRRWHTLDGNGRAIWGTLGNPADPYFTVVDFVGPGFKCSCPVRRMPCKHSIGLLLLFAKQNDAFHVVDEPPEDVTTWLTKRDARRQRQDPSTAPERSPAEEESLAEKRRQNRAKRHYQMAAGLAELESWLTDLLRQGLATLDGQADAYWQELSGRMVDAKLPGIARRMRRFPALMLTDNWHEKLLAEVGDLYLLVQGFRHLQELPEGLQDDLLSVAGVNFKKAEILEGETVTDHWLVAGQTETEEENLAARRTWLVGEKTQQNALLLDFSWGGGGFENQWKLGTVVQGEAAFYPSAWPQRMLFKSFQLTDRPFDLSNGLPTLEKFAAAYAEALGANPWLGQFPAFLQGVVPVFQQEKFYLLDQNDHQLPLWPDPDQGWRLLALSGGHPIGVFGVWNGHHFQPLSAVVEGHFRMI